MKINYHPNPLATKVVLDEPDRNILKLHVIKEEIDDKLFNIEYCQKKNLDLEDDATTIDWEELEEIYIDYLWDLEKGVHYGDCVKFATRCLKCDGEAYLKIPTLWDLVDVEFSKDIGYEVSCLFKDDNDLDSAISKAKGKTKKWLTAYKKKYGDLIK